MPYLSRSWRVITYDGRGNGLSERPTDPDAFRSERIVDDLSAVLDDTGTDAAVLVGLCGDGVWHSILFAGTHPERVLGIVAFAVGVPLLSPPHPWRVRYSTTDELPTDEGWAKLNAHYWRRDYPGFVSFFFDQLLPEPHSTKQHEDTVAWALDGSLESMLGDMHAASDLSLDGVVQACRAVRCPMLLVHGTEDRCQPPARAERLAELTGAPLVIIEGAGHLIPAREPVKANLLIAEFVRGLAGRSR